jgi:hypothetical protein
MVADYQVVPTQAEPTVEHVPLLAAWTADTVSVNDRGCPVRAWLVTLDGKA